MGTATIWRTTGLGALGCLALWATARARRTTRPDLVAHREPSKVVSLEAYRARRRLSSAEPAQDAPADALKEARAAVDLRVRDAIDRLRKAS